MKTVRNGDTVVVVLSPDEVAVLSNCTNEALEALDDWEFDTRVGASRSVVEILGSELRAALRE
jgi:hypothetical protein